MTTLTTTREQDDFAVALATSFRSVEVRALPEGMCAVIGHEPINVVSAVQRQWLLTPDGESLTLGEVVTYSQSIATAATREVAALDRTAPEFEDEVRRIMASCLYRHPQYDDLADNGVVAIATRRLTTKGGLAFEKDEAVVIVRESGFDGTTVYSFRRNGLVSAPSGYVNTIEGR